MSFSFEWHVQDRALLLKLHGLLTVEEAHKINEEMLLLLEETTHWIFLIIDAEEMVSSLPFERIRQIFTFMTHKNLNGVFVVTTSKLSRLLLTVIFVASTANFRLFDKREQALNFTGMQLNRHGS